MDSHGRAQQSHVGGGRGPEAVAGNATSTMPAHCLHAQQALPIRGASREVPPVDQIAGLPGNATSRIPAHHLHVQQGHPTRGASRAVPPLDQIPGLQPEIGTQPSASPSANPFTEACNAAPSSRPPPGSQLGGLRHDQPAVASQPPQGHLLRHPQIHPQTERSFTRFGLTSATGGRMGSEQGLCEGERSLARMPRAGPCPSPETQAADRICQSPCQIAAAEAECHLHTAPGVAASQIPSTDANHRSENRYGSGWPAAEQDRRNSAPTEPGGENEAGVAAMVLSPMREGAGRGSPRRLKRGRSVDTSCHAEQDLPPPAKRLADARGLRGDPSFRIPVNDQVIAAEVRYSQIAWLLCK
jgi:hypothetical protein